MLEKRQKRYRRHKRIRAKISGTAKIPRLYVFRSTKHIYVQLIDDQKGRTLLTASDLELKKPPRQVASLARGKKKKVKKERMAKGGRLAIAYEVGKLIAEKAIKKKIEKVMFDRGGYKYHGRVKAIAEGAREGGIQF